MDNIGIKRMLTLYYSEIWDGFSSLLLPWTPNNVLCSRTCFKLVIRLAENQTKLNEQLLRLISHNGVVCAMELPAVINKHNSDQNHCSVVLFIRISCLEIGFGSGYFKNRYDHGIQPLQFLLQEKVTQDSINHVFKCRSRLPNNMFKVIPILFNIIQTQTPKC